MATYKYRALNPRGRVLNGTLAATNELDLQQQLLQAGITLIEAKPYTETPSALALLRRVRTQDLAQLCLNMEQLQRAGVKLTDALRDVIEATTVPRLQIALANVLQDVDDGSSLSQAMMQHRRIFPPLMIALIAAGETTGRLADAFQELAQHFDWQERLRNRLVRVSAYPLFTVLAMFCVMVLMLGYVVPETSTFLYSLNIALPAHTVALISTSEFFAAYWRLFAIIILLGAGIAYLAGRQSTEVRYVLAGIVLRLPTIGMLLRKINLARFMHTFALMFASGLGMITALETASRTVSNAVLSESLGVIREQVQNGNPLSLALRLSGEFPGMVQRMIRIGEESGKLAPALRHVADYYERDVQETIQSMIGAIGPVLTLIAGGLLIWIAVAVFVPVYNALPQLV
ncbi:MAG: type II secretion system F family protein [Bdellovibrionales bacterium]